MTRVNTGIDPRELPYQLLLAEHREIKRIPNTIKSGRAKICRIPETFRLNEGHVRFFYNKILYLKKRYIKIHELCLSKNYNVTDFSECFEGIPEELMNDYVETPNDRILLIERIRANGFELKPIE